MTLSDRLVKVTAMRLDFLMLADRAEAVNGKLYMVGGGFDRVGAPNFPTNANFDIAIGAMVDYHETNEPHTFELRLEDVDNNVVLGPIGGQVEVGRPPGMKAGQSQRVMIVFRGPFPISAPGEYAWVAVLDGHRESPTKFWLDKVDAPITPPAPRQRG
jgi:hypothetical protein